MMLSTEKPSSPGPSETSQLKNRCKNFISSDERSSDNNKVDLFESGVEDINRTIPKFSLRDYVFSTRAKDIKAHWPFSPKNLQLCLEHGVKDVLPPFVALESVRNPSSAIKYAVNSTSDPSVKFFELNDHLLCGPAKNANQNLASDANCAIKSNALEKDREYQSAMTNVSCSHAKPGSHDLPVLEKPENAVRANKMRSNIPSPNNTHKKCRLIVKLGNNDVAEQKSSEDLLEITMGSKVCPVCKTFTSSSNTTLNAHIDQCLSGESSTKWKGNSRVVKHRIRPRKVRSMADIYETARSCTLEDLDSRNGTNWAFPVRNLKNDYKINSDIGIIRKNGSSSLMDGEDKNKEGNVYFDSNGTKLRILTRFSHVKLNNTTNEDDDCGTRKLIERDKASKIVLGKKKKRLVRRDKLLKCSLFEQSRFKLSPRENEKNVSAQPVEAHDRPMKSNSSGQWASSEGSDLEKKKNAEHESRHHPNKIAKKSSIKGPCQPSINDKLTKRTNDLRFLISSDDNSVSSSDLTHKRREITTLKSVDVYKPYPTNRAGFFPFVSQEFEDEQNRTIMLPKSNFKHLKGTEPSFFSGAKRDRAAFRRNKKMRRINSTFGVKKLPPLNKNPLVQSKIYLPNAESDSRNLSINRSKFSQICKKKWEFMNYGEEGSSYSNHSAESSEPDSHGVGQDINSSLTDTCPAGSADAIEVVEIQDKFFHKPILERPSLITAAFGDSLAFTERENEDKGNYFIDVDPIPIPGPPGSFLPSPGHSGSEELQGNSSLTLMIHSPKDNGPESDSPSSYCIPIVERPLPFEQVRVVDQPKNDGPRADLVFPDNNFRGCGDCESPASSTANNPILRLMGKNLMVVNYFPNLLSNDDSQNECRPLSRNLYQGPPVLDYLHFQSNLEVPALLLNPSRVMISSRNTNEGSRSSFECHDQLKSAVELDHPPPIRPEFEKRPVFVPQLGRTPDSCYHKHNEIVPTNNSRKDGSSLAYNEAYSEIGGLGYESRPANAAFGCQTRCYPFPNGSRKTVGSSNIAQMPSFKWAKGNSSVNLNLNVPKAETTRDSLTALSSSAGYQRSSSSCLTCSHVPFIHRDKNRYP